MADVVDLVKQKIKLELAHHGRYERDPATGKDIFHPWDIDPQELDFAMQMGLSDLANEEQWESTAKINETISLTAGQRFVDLPVDFSQELAIRIGTVFPVFVEAAQFERMRAGDNTNTEENPGHYTKVGKQFYFHLIPASTKTFTLIYATDPINAATELGGLFMSSLHYAVMKHLLPLGSPAQLAAEKYYQQSVGKSVMKDQLAKARAFRASPPRVVALGNRWIGTMP